jgi:hypothetical protein
MNKFANPLNNVRIASPCKADWNQMIGDDRRRFCGACNLNVYNLSAMTRAEAENLLVTSEGRLCARFYQRADGTILTKDCPVGWQAIKRRASKMMTAAASLVFGVFSGLGINAYFNEPEQEILMGDMSYEMPATQPVETIIEPVRIVSTKQKFEPVMGRMDISRDPEIDYPVAVAGGITNLDEVRRQVKAKRRR